MEREFGMWRMQRGSTRWTGGNGVGFRWVWVHGRVGERMSE